MKSILILGVLAAIGISARLQSAEQEKPPARSGRTAVLNVRDCLDHTRNVWIADIDLELQRLQEADAGRAGDLNPQERQRIRTKHIEIGNRRRLEVYAELVRISRLIAQERGFEIVERVDRVPIFEPGDADPMAQIDRRIVISYDPEVDLTLAVLERLNRDYTARKK
jgi:hypothetical protein